MSVNYKEAVMIPVFIFMSLNSWTETHCFFTYYYTGNIFSIIVSTINNCKNNCMIL